MLKGKENRHIIISGLTRTGMWFKIILNKIRKNKNKIKSLLLYLIKISLLIILIIWATPKNARIILFIFSYILVYLLAKCNAISDLLSKYD